jgi:hypothetical protein
MELVALDQAYQKEVLHKFGDLLVKSYKLW